MNNNNLTNTVNGGIKTVDASCLGGKTTLCNKFAGTITRTQLLYKTEVEYGDYCVNFCKGCSHGCLFPCYAFKQSQRFNHTSYEEWRQPKLVSNTLELLEKALKRKRKEPIKNVQLCFTTDPFMYGYPEVGEMGLAVVKLLHENNITARVLTKGILPEALAEYSDTLEAGITLVTLDEEFRKKYEPGAAPLAERLASLKKLHDLGCYTYISMEPFMTPNIHEADLDALLDAVKWVDKIYFGRAHYNKLVTAYKEHNKFYNDCADKVEQFCAEHGIDCLIKQKTRTECCK